MRKETIEVLVIEPNDQLSDYQQESWMHSIVFRESKERGPELYSCRTLPKNGARVRANDLALAQPPGENSGDSQSNQTAQTAEAEKEGGCCQQHLVRAFGSPPRFVINMNEVVYVGSCVFALGPCGVIVTRDGLMYPLTQSELETFLSEFTQSTLAS